MAYRAANRSIAESDRKTHDPGWSGGVVLFRGQVLPWLGSLARVTPLLLYGLELPCRFKLVKSIRAETASYAATNQRVKSSSWRDRSRNPGGERWGTPATVAVVTLKDNTAREP